MRIQDNNSGHSNLFTSKTKPTLRTKLEARLRSLGEKIVLLGKKLGTYMPSRGLHKVYVVRPKSSSTTADASTAALTKTNRISTEKFSKPDSPVWATAPLTSRPLPPNPPAAMSASQLSQTRRQSGDLKEIAPQEVLLVIKETIERADQEMNPHIQVSTVYRLLELDGHVTGMIKAQAREADRLLLHSEFSHLSSREDFVQGIAESISKQQPSLHLQTVKTIEGLVSALIEQKAPPSAFAHMSRAIVQTGHSDDTYASARALFVLKKFMNSSSWVLFSPSQASETMDKATRPEVGSKPTPKNSFEQEQKGMRSTLFLSMYAADQQYQGMSAIEALNECSGGQLRRLAAYCDTVLLASGGLSPKEVAQFAPRLAAQMVDSAALRGESLELKNIQTIGDIFDQMLEQGVSVANYQSFTQSLIALSGSFNDAQSGQRTLDLVKPLTSSRAWPLFSPFSSRPEEAATKSSPSLLTIPELTEPVTSQGAAPPDQTALRRRLFIMMSDANDEFSHIPPDTVLKVLTESQVRRLGAYFDMVLLRPDSGVSAEALAAFAPKLAEEITQSAAAAGESVTFHDIQTVGDILDQLFASKSGPNNYKRFTKELLGLSTLLNDSLRGHRNLALMTPLAASPLWPLFSPPIEALR